VLQVIGNDPQQLQPVLTGPSCLENTPSLLDLALSIKLIKAESTYTFDLERFHVKSYVASRSTQRAQGKARIISTSQTSSPLLLRSIGKYNRNDLELTLNDDGSVRAGTLPALIQRLTMHSGIDEQFEETFIMTFKTFATIDQVVDRLVERYHIQPPALLEPKQLQEWKINQETPIHLRVIDIIRKILNTIEQEDIYILDKLKQFLEQATASDQVEVTYTAEPQRTIWDIPLDEPLTPILPRTAECLRLMDIEPSDLAQQLTIMESELFSSIKPSEWIAQLTGSTSPSYHNIKAVVTLTDWVVNSIIGTEDSRRRARTIKHFINTANASKNSPAFVIAALLAGLNSPVILGLKRTWEEVQGRERAMLNNMRAILDVENHFQAYRYLLSELQPPCVPFLGVYLVTLNGFRDNIKDTIEGGALINFQKQAKIADVLREINKIQKHQYDLTSIPAIQEFLEKNLAIKRID
ncbi:13751_t:CDS:2, partial [Acaulospora colombiana]